MDDDLKLYSVEEAGKILKKTRRTMYNYIKAGQIKAVKFGRDWRISEKDLKEFSAKGTEPDYLDKIFSKKRGQ